MRSLRGVFFLGGPLAFGLVAGVTAAQNNPLPVKVKTPASALRVAHIQLAAPVTLAPSAASLSFGVQPVKEQSAALSATLTNPGSTTLTGIAASISGPDAGEFATTTGNNSCGATLSPGDSCTIYVTFTPSAARSFVANLNVTYSGAGSPVTAVLSGTGKTPAVQCWFIPVKSECISGNDSLNQFFGVSDKISFLHQVKSIYNGASGSDTVSADIATLYFPPPVAFEITAGTNIQAGATPPTTVSAGTTPTLSSTAAAQATQNLLYGGTIVATVSYPLIAIGANGVNQSGNFGTRIDVAGRGGVDIQSFKSGTSSSATAPPSHGSAQLQGYMQYNSTKLSQNENYDGAIFFGFAYGYDYMSHGYQRDYGFSNVHNGMGQISAGILISGVATISVSRAFGPSQTYIDSTSSAVVTANNFKAWSFGISYQSAGSK